jgi:hypothetical protein
VQTGPYQFTFALLGLAGGPLLRADSVTFPTAAVNQPVAAHLSEPREEVVTVALVIPTSPKQRPLPAEEVMPSAMVFHDVPVGLVARIIGVRLGQKVEIEANATQPISGDFGHMDLIQALNEAAAKAGLVVIDEGPEGLHLVPRDSSLGKARSGSVPSVLTVAVTPIGKSTADLAAESQRKAVLKAADEKRIELLKLRAKLLLQEPDQ